MALEQQHQQIMQMKEPDPNGTDLKQSINSQSHLSVNPEHMQVSYFYIPHMSSLVEVKQVRKALLPFVEQLLEHHVDLQVRHLTIYHHTSIDEVNAALQYLRLGAELQQTLSHYEPLYPQKSNVKPLHTHKQHADPEFHSMPRFFYSVWERIQQWLKALGIKKD